MRTEIINIYKFEELSDKAKEVARSWYRNDEDCSWSEFIIEDAKTIAALFGLEIENVYFSGFSSQGDGACFEGRYSYKKDSVKVVKSHAGKDPELFDIIGRLQEIQRADFYQLVASVKHSGHYSHKYCTDFSIEREDEKELSTNAEEDLMECLRDFMEWIYKRLNDEYDYITSDKAVDENIISNEYEFYGNGEVV